MRTFLQARESGLRSNTAAGPPALGRKRLNPAYDIFHLISIDYVVGSEFSNRPAAGFIGLKHVDSRLSIAPALHLHRDGHAVAHSRPDCHLPHTYRHLP